MTPWWLREKSFHYKGNFIGQETDEEKSHRYFFEACERYLTNSDSDTKSYATLTQYAKEKVKNSNRSKKVIKIIKLLLIKLSVSTNFNWQVSLSN